MPPASTTTATAHAEPSVAEPYVAELWRYPVKSLRGERLATAELTAAGIPGDRGVHLRQPLGRVVTSRTRPGLLGLQGSLDEDGEPLVDGLPWRDAAALAAVRAVAGEDVELIRHERLER